MSKLVNPVIPFKSICVCFAADENYAKYMKVAIYSLLCNRNRRYGYDIIILHANITNGTQREILQLEENQEGVSIRFIDVSEEEYNIEYDVGAYYSIAANYRLLLFSERFQQYDRVLYIDSDTIILGDISELFYMDLEGNLVAAVEEMAFRTLAIYKIAIFIDGCYPYNADNYRTDALGMKHPEAYFNSGVMLIDLKRCRETFSFQDIISTLHSKNFQYNDQDVLNIIMDGHVKLIDYIWNYQNNIESYINYKTEEMIHAFKGVERQEYKIVHYISSKKPWNSDVALSEHYHYYNNQLEGEVL